MKKCKTCRFWSEMLAHSLGGPIEAYCLQGRGPKASQGYTSESFACDAWKESTIGAIDSPGFDGTEYGSTEAWIELQQAREQALGAIP